MDFIEFEIKYFDKLDNKTWRVIRDYYYLHRFSINYNFNSSKNCTTTILKAIETD